MVVTRRVRHLLVVVGGRDVAPVLRGLDPGLTLTAMVSVGHWAKVRFPGENARVIALDPARGRSEWLALARCVHGCQPVDAVAAFGEAGQGHAAAIAQDLGLPFHPGGVVDAVHDKLLMRRRLGEAGVEDVPSAAVPSAAHVQRFAAAHGLPLILKPRSGAGSLGIVKVTRATELAAAHARAVAAAPGAEIVAEPFLPGPEISVEAVSEDGEHRVVGVTAKVTDANFVELGHVVRAPRPQDGPAVAHVVAALTALGVQDGPTHTELILTGAGPRVVETHVRAGGDRIPQLLHAATGVDLVELAARQALGERVLPGLDSRPAGGGRVGAVRYLVPPRSGRLVTVHGVDDALAVPHVTACSVLLAAGHRVVSPVRRSGDRLAFCTAVADDAATAAGAAVEAVGRLVPEIVPEIVPGAGPR